MTENGFSNQSASITKIAPALLKAQKAIGSAKKETINPFFKSKYADLGAVLEVCKDALNDNGIIVLQPIVSNGDGVCVLTTLLHESGEFLCSQLRIAAQKDHDPQSQGSAITYARRYGLQALLSIPSEDDDGNLASGKPAEAHMGTKPSESAKPASLGDKVLVNVFMPSGIKKIKDRNGKDMAFIKDGETSYSAFNQQEWETAEKALNEGKQIEVYYTENGKYKTIKSLGFLGKRTTEAYDFPEGA